MVPLRFISTITLHNYARVDLVTENRCFQNHRVIKAVGLKYISIFQVKPQLFLAVNFKIKSTRHCLKVPGTI